MNHCQCLIGVTKRIINDKWYILFIPFHQKFKVLTYISIPYVDKITQKPNVKSNKYTKKHTVKEKDKCHTDQNIWHVSFCEYSYLSFHVSGVICAADYYELMDLCDGGLQFFPMCLKVSIIE